MNRFLPSCSKALSSGSLLVLLAACAQLPPAPQAPVEVSLFALNDFHGQIQASDPLPARLAWPDATSPEPAGGAACLASALAELRAHAANSLLVGAGDLIGASPAQSALLEDEPSIEILNRLGMSVSTLGNHEFDHGRDSLRERISGDCGAKGCALAGFKGARYDYLAANVIDEASGRPWLKPYVIREVGGERIAFVGAVTRTLPDMVAASGLRGLRVEDEALAINRVVPEIRAQGVESIVALIHEGAEYAGPLNEPDYRCEGLRGPIIDIVERLDPAIDAVFSGHTHQAYTCRIAGRLVVQGRNYGALIAEIRLAIDPQSHDVVRASAALHPVRQPRYAPDPAVQAYMTGLEQATEAIRQRLVVELAEPLSRRPDAASHNDSPLGTVVNDAQLALARDQGVADLALTNAGGVRADLPARVTHGATYAAQPFGNDILVVSLSGGELLDVLAQQWRSDPAHPVLLQSSSNLAYRWRVSGDPAGRIVDLRLDGQPVVADKIYRVVINGFLADGGDGFSVFKLGRERQVVGQDLDALEAYLRAHADKLNFHSQGRIARLDD